MEWFKARWPGVTMLEALWDSPWGVKSAIKNGELLLLLLLYNFVFFLGNLSLGQHTQDERGNSLCVGSWCTWWYTSLSGSTNHPCKSSESILVIIKNKVIQILSTTDKNQVFTSDANYERQKLSNWIIIIVAPYNAHMALFQQNINYLQQKPCNSRPDDIIMTSLSLCRLDVKFTMCGSGVVNFLKSSFCREYVMTPERKLRLQSEERETEMFRG